MDRDHWRGKSYSFISHKSCEYFPCHTIGDEERFNCLFCYCPLYALGSECGGNLSYTKDGVKNCSECAFPHEKDHYGLVMEKLQRVVEQVKNKG